MKQLRFSIKYWYISIKLKKVRIKVSTDQKFWAGPEIKIKNLPWPFFFFFFFFFSGIYARSFICRSQTYLFWWYIFMQVVKAVLECPLTGVKISNALLKLIFWRKCIKFECIIIEIKMKNLPWPNRSFFILRFYIGFSQV